MPSPHSSHRRPRLLAALVTLCALAPAVALALMARVAPDSPDKRVESAHANPDWSGVVAVRVGGNVYSGVLLTDRYVLTAAHVAAGSVDAPADLELVFHLPGGTRTISAAKIHVIPGFHFPYDDLALVRLSADAPAGARRYPVQDKVISPTNDIITLVGHGGSGPGNSGLSVGSNVSARRVGENVIDLLTDKMDTSGHSSAFYLYDFDGPDGNGALGGPTLGNTRETMVAPGDSGSPAFVVAAGHITVAGINTFATPLGKGTISTYTFGQGGGGMRLSEPRFLTWLKMTSGNGIRLASEPANDGQETTIPLDGAAAFAGVALLVFLVWRRARVRARP